MGTLTFLFNLIPTIKPFFKEFFLGEKVPTGGKVRNPLINVLVGTLLVSGFGLAYGIDYWIKKYDQVQNLELTVDKLKQELKLTEKRAEALNEQAIEANKVYGELSRTKSELVASNKHVDELLTLNNSLSEENGKLLKRVKEVLDELETFKRRPATVNVRVLKPKPVSKSHNYQSLLNEEP